MNIFNKRVVVKRLFEVLLTANKSSCLLGQKTILLNLNMGCYKLIHTSSSFFSKLYVAKENDYAHSILENSVNYKIVPAKKIAANTLSKEEVARLISQDWENCTCEEIVSQFRHISYYNQSNNITEPISDTCYDKMCLALVSKCTSFNFDQMCDVLHCLSLWAPTESTHSHNFKQLWRALDEACIAQIKEWNVGQLLLLNDYWYQLSLAGINFFTWQSLNRCSRKAARSSPYFLVQSLFYINLRRVFPPAVDFIDYQVQLAMCAEKLSVEELGVCAMAFFKTQKKIRSTELLQIMLAKTTAQIDTVHPITLASILKVVRSSLSVGLVDQLHHLLIKVQPRIATLPLVCCLHIALSGTNIQLMLAPVIEAVLNRFLSELSDTRIKDLERILFVLSHANWPAKLPDGRNVYEVIAAEVAKAERVEEIKTHPRCITNILNYLGIAGVYLQPQISMALSSSFMQNIYSKSMKQSGIEVLSLDVTVQLECRDYTGSKLPQKSRCLLAKQVSQHPYQWQKPEGFAKGTAGDKILREMILFTSKLVKDPDMIFVGHLLPQYYRPDILVRVSDTLDFLPIPASLRNVDLGELRRPVGPGYWISFIVANQNLYLRGSNLLVGSMVQKLRLLHILGYTPSVIPWFEWQAISNQSDYIRNKIRTTVKTQVLAS